MTNESNRALVLREAEGTCCRISREVIEGNRVPEEEKARLEETLDDDTRGHMINQDRVQPGPEGTGGGGGLPLPLPNPISVVKFFAQGVRDLPYNRNPL